MTLSGSILDFPLDRLLVVHLQILYKESQDKYIVHALFHLYIPGTNLTAEEQTALVGQAQKLADDAIANINKATTNDAVTMLRELVLKRLTT